MSYDLIWLFLPRDLGFSFCFVVSYSDSHILCISQIKAF
jgi:hypothetical protein